MFMFHKNPSYNARKFPDGWRCDADISGATELSKLIVKYHNSPCLWAHGIRLKVNFRRAYWVGLDFDKLVTLDYAIQTFGDFIHVIATTKSHGINGDRFRVFLKLNSVCRNPHDYEATVRLLIKQHGADPACCDAARLFFKCKEIVSVNYSGKVLSIVDGAKAELKKQKNIEKHKQKIAMYYAPGRFIPGSTRLKLDQGVPDGTRNPEVYKVAKVLGRCGYSESEALEMILNSRIPLDNSQKVTAEVKEVVKRAFM